MNRRPFLRRAPSQSMSINSVFISYNRDDLSLIKPLEQALKAKGLIVWRDQERVYGGDNWPKGIGEAIRDTDAVVLCWSNNASQSHFVEMEWSIALALKKVVIPFQMDNTGLHPSLSFINGVKTTDGVLRALQRSEVSHEPRAEHIVLDALEKAPASSPEQIAHMVRDTLQIFVSGGTNTLTINQYYGGEGGGLPKKLTRLISGVQADQVVGREADLKDLHTRLFSNQPVVLVNGLGGIGKTTLAQAYLGRHIHEYRHIAWITQLSDDFAADFISTEGLLDRLRIDRAGKDIPALYEEAMAALGTLGEGPNLLVIDNAFDSFQPYVRTLPAPPKWHVLVTSRETIRGLSVKELDFLSEEEAITLFRLHYTRKALSDEAIRSLVRSVDVHTLTIEILARTAQRQRLSVDTLQQAIENDLRARVYTNHREDRIERVTSYLRSIFAVSDLEYTSHEYWLLKQFSCLPPDFHSYEVLTRLVDPEAHGRSEVFSETLETLVEKGWLLSDEDKDAYKMHRIVQEVVKREVPVAAEDVLPLIEELARLLYLDETKDNPVDKFPWVPFGRTVTDRLPDSSHEKVAALQNNLALRLRDLGDYEGAKHYIEKALASDLTNFGEEHPETAIRYSNLALVLQDLGDYEGAKAYLEKALASALTNFGEEHPTTAVRYSNLGTVLQDLGDYEGAKAYLERALASDLTNFGEEHPTTAVSYSNLALVLQDLGDYEGAKAYMEKALDSHLTNFGEEHPTTAVRYSNLGTVLQDLGDYEGAKAYLERALASDLTNFGEEHPTTAVRYSNLGTVLQDLGDYEGAKAYLERALASDLTNFGEEHPNTARSYSNLALVLQALGDYEGAKAYMEKALASDLTNFGESHPNTALRYSNLAMMLKDLGDYEGAKAYLEKALDSDLTNFGEEHPNTAIRYWILASILQDLKKYGEALGHVQKALEVFRTTLPEGHSYITGALSTYNSIKSHLDASS